MKIQSVCDNTVSELVENNLLSEGTKFSNSCGRVDILQSEKQSVCNNTVSEIVKNNLLPERTKFTIHVKV